MILRNTAGQAILIGPLLLKADGVDQATGAAISVRKDGVDVGAPGGSLTHVASGVWQYTPTQGETDCGIMGLLLTKADCATVPLNVLTTRLPVQTAVGATGGVAASDDVLVVKTKTDNLPVEPASEGTVTAVGIAVAALNDFDPATDQVIVVTNNDKTGYALTSDERNAIAAALLDLANGIETGVTLRQSQRAQLSALAAKLSGANTPTITIRDAGDTKDRIIAAVDANGNRTAMTLDLD